MFRVVRLSNKLYGYEIADIDEDVVADIETFVSEGTPVILTDELSAVEDMFGEEVHLVARE